MKKSSVRQQILDLVPKGSIGAEIGVHLGDFSQQILDIVQPAHLYLIDPWMVNHDEAYKMSWYGCHTAQEEMDSRYKKVVERFKDAPVEVIRGTSYTAQQHIKQGTLDFVYIDGDHSYQGVKSDIWQMRGRLKIGGLFIFDDCHAHGWWRRGVLDAVEELIAQQALVKKLDDQIVVRRCT